MISATDADARVTREVFLLCFYVLLKVGLRGLNCDWYTLGSDLPGKAGEVDQSDVPGTRGRAGGGPHVRPWLPSVRYLRHSVHHDTEAVSLGQWPAWQWVVSDSPPWLCTFSKCSVTRLATFIGAERSIGYSIWKEIAKETAKQSSSDTVCSSRFASAD